MERHNFKFHVVEGDDLFHNDSWVTEDNFDDDWWVELLDYIVWNKVS